MTTMQLKLEIPYDKALLLPVEGSEALLKYLEKGVMVSQDWRDSKYKMCPDKIKVQVVYPEWQEDQDIKVEGEANDL